MRLAFLGSPPFGTAVLRRVLASPHETGCVVTRPDRPRGRGRAVVVSEMAVLAAGHRVPLLQPTSTKTPEFVAQLAAHEPDVLLVASYGEILRRDVLELAPHGALNVHASLLPRHRGASPIQAAILAGDRETGVSIQRMVPALDEGDVLLERSTPIGDGETAGELLARLAELGGEAACEALDLLATGRATFMPQDPARATYARKIEKHAGDVDWTCDAEAIERHVRAMTPWPGARARLDDGRGGAKDVVLLRVARAVGSGKPGAVLEAEKRLVVAAGDGALEVLELKPAGKPAMDGASFLRGARLAPGARFHTGPGAERGA